MFYDENNKNGQNDESGAQNGSGGETGNRQENQSESGYAGTGASDGFNGFEGPENGEQPNIHYDESGSDSTNAASENGAAPADGGVSGNAGPNPGDPYGGNMQYRWNYDDYQKALGAKTKKKRRNRGLIAFIVSICSVFGLAVVAFAGYGVYTLAKNGVGLTGSAAATASESAANTSGPAMTLNNQPAGTATSSTSSGGKLTVQQCAQKVQPSVVGIVDYSHSSIGETGEGSGIIMTSDGYIITNNHVVSSADYFQVVLENGKKYPATLVGTDARTDLAVLKIKATGLTPATFGNSEQLQVGDDVITIGNPGGLELAESVTKGIVSALNRQVQSSSSGYTMTYIQTDAAINPGNSGGALVNMYGQVVGINAAKISGDGYEGLGFSIPINIAKPVIDSIIKYGYVKDRVKLGITCETFDEMQAQYHNMPAGLLVDSVDSSSDAYNKIQKYDIITKVNGAAVSDANGLLTAESKYKPGQSMSLTVYRYSTGSTFTVSVKLMEDRGTTTSAATTTSSSSNGYSNGYGNGNQYSYNNGDNADSSTDGNAANG